MLDQCAAGADVHLPFHQVVESVEFQLTNVRAHQSQRRFESAILEQRHPLPFNTERVTQRNCQNASWTRTRNHK